jgi:folate-binding protein YgfZ
MIGPGYQALHEGAALLDLEGRGVLIAAGEDRARLLHAMSTNHVTQLQPGDLCYAFFLNAQGRVLADAGILCLQDALLLDTEPERSEFLLQHLNKFIIADDVTLENAGGRFAVLDVEGPKAGELLSAMGLEPLPGQGKWTPWQAWMVSAMSSTGAPGYRIHAPAGERVALKEWLHGAGATEATPEEAHAVRLENGRPRYGEDITDSHIPHETRQLHAVHFNKGCYLGQEIVERVRSRGHVNRSLVQLLIDGQSPPPRGTKALSGSSEIGEITSAAYSPRLGRVAALGYVRTEQAKPPLTVDGRNAEITSRVPGEPAT